MPSSFLDRYQSTFTLPDSNPLQAKLVLEELISDPEFGEDAKTTANIYGAYSSLLIRSGEFSEGLKFAQKAYDASSNLNDSVRVSTTHSYAYALDAFGDKQSARRLYLQAIQLAKELGQADPQSRLLCNLGRLHAGLGDIQGALKYYKEALKACGNNHGWQAYLTTLGNISTLCALSGDTVSARSYLELALSAPVTDANRYNNTGLLPALANLCYLEKNYLEAIEWSNKAYLRGSEYGYRMVQVDALMGRGSAKLGMNDTVGALADYREAISIELEPNRLLNIKALLALALAKNGDTPDTLTTIAEVERDIDVMQDVEKKFVYENLSETKAYLGNFEGAYRDRMSSLELQSTLYSAQVKQEMVSFRLVMQVEREDHERKIQELRDLQEKELIRIELKKREQEVRQTAMHLAAQTEMLGKFQVDLRRIIRLATDPAQALKEVSAKLKELPCEQIDWSKFESEFTAAHPDFKDKLREKYPQLSNAEVRLCTLIRLDLKTPEIARMTCLSERTIETQRLSVRRKLRLSREDNLPEILKSV